MSHSARIAFSGLKVLSVAVLLPQLAPAQVDLPGPCFNDLPANAVFRVDDEFETSGMKARVRGLVTWEGQPADLSGSAGVQPYFWVCSGDSSNKLFVNRSTVQFDFDPPIERFELQYSQTFLTIGMQYNVAVNGDLRLVPFLLYYSDAVGGASVRSEVNGGSCAVLVFEGGPIASIRVGGEALILECSTETRAAERFVRGDADQDGKQDISDALGILGRLFLGGVALGCEDAADANDDGEIAISDAVYLLDFLFLCGPEPPLPSPECGGDPTADGLECGAAGACA